MGYASARRMAFSVESTSGDECAHADGMGPTCVLEEALRDLAQILIELKTTAR